MVFCVTLPHFHYKLVSNEKSNVPDLTISMRLFSFNFNKALRAIEQKKKKSGGLLYTVLFIN